MWFGPWANIVNNFYQSPSCANQTMIISDSARAYASGNVSGNGPSLNLGNTLTAFPAPGTTDPTCAEATRVLQQAGVRPLDSLDQGNVSQVSLAKSPGNGASVPPTIPVNLQLQ